MNKSYSIHRATYIISIQSEYQQSSSPVFRGTLETIAGQELEFSTLAELNGLLCEICGWIDTLPRTNEGGEESR